MAQLTCQRLCVGYEGKSVLQELNFEVFAGDYLCIVGENGSGKSTLMKTILGLQPPISGKILTGDGLRKNEIGYLPQQTVVQKDFPAAVREIVLSGCQGRCGSRPFYSKEEKHLFGVGLGFFGRLLRRRLWTGCSLRSLQNAAIGSCPADNSRGFCLLVRCVPPEKCCFSTSLFPGLIPRQQRKCMRLSKNLTGTMALR